jgi:hypothetical protein
VLIYVIHFWKNIFLKIWKPGILWVLGPNDRAPELKHFGTKVNTIRAGRSPGCDEEKWCKWIL